MEIVFDKIDKRYGQTYAVKNLSLTIKNGALHFFLGPSGCGKTTTLRMLAGLEKPTAGRILFNGKDVTNQPAAERGIGMVFQNYALWPHMTVQKNIEYGLKLRKLSTEEIDRRVKEVVGFTQLDGYEDRMPGQLSGGQQQRVALARALAIRPNVLLLDEPLSNLDAQLRLEMRDNISRIHKQTGITTVYVTHDQKEALSMGTEISVMRLGSLIQSGHPRKLYYHPESSFIASFIGETNLIDGTVTKTGETIEIETSMGILKSRNAAGSFTVGNDVQVSLRPEAIGIDFDRPMYPDAENVFKLRIEHLTYLGESEQFQLECSDKTRIKATIFHSPEHSLKEDDMITCRAAANDVLVLPKSPEKNS